ncbi:MAG: hypothetical protein JWM57_818 [Phycisphaerales bacterium]|nr:hypothetical protein [Phycisphaerales bacterium]
MKSASLEASGLRVTFDAQAEGCFCTLTDLRTGHTWPRVPALVLEVYDRTLQRIERFEKVEVKTLERVDDAIHLTVANEYRGISVGVWVTLTATGELSFWLSTAEAYEHRHGLYRIAAVDLLPGLMRAGPDGELLLPINTGVLCSPADKPARSDRFLIYGEQHRWELLPTLPVAAVNTPAGGLVAMAAAGAAETECRVSTDGRGNGTVGLSFWFRNLDIDPVEQSPREIRFALVPPRQDITGFTAGVLRRHVTQELGKPTLTQRAKESPEVAHLLGATIMKLFYGVQAQGIMLGEGGGASAQPKFLLTMTFDEAKTGLKAFHDAGVDKIYTQNVGWNFRGHDGAYPTRFPVERRSGGEAAFRDLIAYGHNLGYQMTVHDNYLDAYECSADFDPDVIIRDPYGQLQVRGFWGGGTSYVTWPLAFADKHMAAEMRRIKELGIRGPYYLDGMGSPLYTNYHPKHGGTRTAMAQGIDRILTTARDLYASSATETGYLYCSLTPDLVANPGNDGLKGLCRPEWPITDLIGDRCVPLWQMVMSGLVVTENQGLAWTDTMRALLYAQHPRYEWSTRPGVQPVLDAAMIRKIKFRHDLLIKRFGHLRTQQMTAYERDSGYESTTFEDGTVVTADFDAGVLRVDGEMIPNPDAASDGNGRLTKVAAGAA